MIDFSLLCKTNKLSYDFYSLRLIFMILIDFSLLCKTNNLLESMHTHVDVVESETEVSILRYLRLNYTVEKSETISTNATETEHLNQFFNLAQTLSKCLTEYQNVLS